MNTAQTGILDPVPPLARYLVFSLRRKGAARSIERALSPAFRMDRAIDAFSRALMDRPLREAFGYAAPSPRFEAAAHAALRLRGQVGEYVDETPDQLTAIEEVKADMESKKPMDRLICGDVGYGKTEVAIRAAFKAVMDGMQVAVLCPTTVLAEQHWNTFRERMAGYPITIEMLSRFRTPGETKKVVKLLAEGGVDIVIGTHRLLSGDVVFKNLGLVVIDEEQRFGVLHKEKFKQLRKLIDVVTLSATPIPRTLYLSLTGARDMSTIETPPVDRLPAETIIAPYDERLIKQAIQREINRGGQVYFLHNRVQSIDAVADRLRSLFSSPADLQFRTNDRLSENVNSRKRSIRIDVGHGQMSEHELESVMHRFIKGDVDVLVCTTIIESGLDIPNANTIIINRADRYGLSQLYQLRGRVGRSDRPAYAYLLIPPEDTLTPVAKKRLAAMKEFSDLGSGFRVAALDLEIRGAGNLLGGEQSGQIDAVGFEMYMKLLEDTVRELKGEDIEDDVRANVNLRIDLRIDAGYIPDTNQRLTLYRTVASARRDEQIDAVLEDAADRYGPLPVSVLNLADYGRIRIMADQLGVESIDRDGRTVVLKFGSRSKVDPTRLVAMVRARGDVTILPPSGLKLALDGQAPAARAGAQGARTGGDARTPAARAPKRPEMAPSWWTARARAGEVTPGFSKAEILAPRTDDPRAPGGLFERLGGLLSDMLG